MQFLLCTHHTTSYKWLSKKCENSKCYLCIVCGVHCLYLFMGVFRLAGDQRARRDARHDSDAEDDDDVKKV